MGICERFYKEYVRGACLPVLHVVLLSDVGSSMSDVGVKVKEKTYRNRKPGKFGVRISISTALPLPKAAAQLQRTPMRSVALQGEN